MASFPNLPGQSSAHATPSFQEGVAAFQNNDYLNALAYFAAVLEAHPDDGVGIHAHMAMIISYEKYGQPDVALQHCVSLRQDADTMVQSWCDRAIASLCRRYPALNQPTSGTGASRSEQGASDQPFTTAAFTAHTYQWRNAGRLPKGRSLAKLPLWRFRVLQLATLVVMVTATIMVVDWLKIVLARLLDVLPVIDSRQLEYANITIPVLVSIAILFLASPWLMDLLLKTLHNLTFQPARVLGKYSPEALGILNQFSQRKRVGLPKLGILPTTAPLSLSYGYLPRHSRIILSQGLLDSLTAEELATICAVEVAHGLRGDTIVMTWLITLLQIPYLLYWGIAIIADRFYARITKLAAIVAGRWQATAQGRRPYWRRCVTPRYVIVAWPYYGLLSLFYVLALLSGLGYTLHWGLRLPVLLLSRQRVYWGDRLATELTGNPNGLTRALLKIAIGTASTIQAQGQTPYLLDSLEPLTPVGHRTGAIFGSLFPHVATEALLAWDLENPYRFWLVAGHAHPLMGDRLRWLATIAQYWQLESELSWTAPTAQATTRLTPQTRSLLESLRATMAYAYGLLLQGAPYVSLPVGIALGFLTWGIMWLLDLVGWRAVGWMVGHPVIFQAVVLFGMSLSLLLWINPFFPEITPTNSFGLPTGQADRTLLTQQFSVALSLAANPQVSPSQSQRVQLSGRLLGRAGTANLFGQDLLLQSDTGLVRVHHWFRFSPLLEYWLQPHYPSRAVGRIVEITGWLRRGASLWLDVDTLRHPDGTIAYGGHAVWMTIVAILFGLWASYLVITTTG